MSTLSGHGYVVFEKGLLVTLTGVCRARAAAHTAEGGGAGLSRCLSVVELCVTSLTVLFLTSGEAVRGTLTMQGF